MIKTIQCTFLAACVLMTGMVFGQSTPSTSEMIEQLKTPPTMKTRGLRSTRNLGVSSTGKQENDEAGSARASESERPSVSLLIQFDFDSVRIRPESKQSLSNLAKALNSAELNGASFLIEGHTDAKGTQDYNQQLSGKRAEQVREFLAQQGVRTSRLSALGKGSSELVNSNDPLAAENRRVRIVNLN